MDENHRPIHILVVGGTGQCGQVFIPRALEAGHQLTLYARNPSKFSHETVNHPNVKIVKGEFTDIDNIMEALSKGAELLVSFAGPDFPFNKGMVSYSCSLKITAHENGHDSPSQNSTRGYTRSCQIARYDGVLSYPLPLTRSPKTRKRLNGGLASPAAFASLEARLTMRSTA